MKLSTCLNYINQALNYPALTYQDVTAYFDMAMSELNVSLHTAIPLVSEMLDKFRQYLSNVVRQSISISSSAVNQDIPISTTDPQSGDFYYNSTLGKYGVRTGTTFEYRSTLYAYATTNGDTKHYEAYKISANRHIWTSIEIIEDSFEISEYLPDDWVLMWLIPYICFKYTVRDGGTAATFVEELTQGFQALQDTYDIPDTIPLANYADKIAYKEDVIKYLPNLNIKIPTKAIFTDMKHGRIVNGIYGNVYDSGGFGV